LVPDDALPTVRDRRILNTELTALPFPQVWNTQRELRLQTMGRSNQSREVRLNQQVKDLIQKLGEAIHQSVAESDSIAGVVKEIREQGFEVLLMLEATIGLNESEDEAEEGTGEEGNSVAEGPFTHNDLNFLKSLRITTDELDESKTSEEEGKDGSPPAA
jgi:hypothetical protein